MCVYIYIYTHILRTRSCAHEQNKAVRDRKYYPEVGNFASQECYGFPHTVVAEVYLRIAETGIFSKKEQQINTINQ